MKKSIIPWWWMAGGIDAGYQAILDAGETGPSAAQRIKQNRLYVRFKSAGILDLTDTWYVTLNDVAGGFWKLNWKAPGSFKCTEPAGAVTKVSNGGIQGNGSSTYAECNFTPSTQATQLSATTGGAQAIFLTTVPTVGTYLCGAQNVGGNNPYTYMRFASAISYVYRTLDDAQGSSYTGGTPDGTFIYADATPTAYSIWKNGISVQGASNSATLQLPGTSVRIGSASGNAGGFGNGVEGMYWLGAPLSDAQKLEMYNAWAEYIS